MITLTRGVYDEIISHGYDGGDEEICGVLAGEYGETQSHILDVYSAENAADTPQNRYAIDPKEHLELMEAIDDVGLDVVGFYHSHPSGPPHPSKTDAAQATWSGYSYIICAYDGYPYLGSWRWQEDGFDQELVTIDER